MNHTTLENTLPWEGNLEGCYRIGRVAKPHGVKGELSVTIDDDVFDRVEADFVILATDGLPVPFFFESYRFRSDEQVLMKFEGIDSEAEARRLSGCGVYFPRALAETDEEQASLAELRGYEVVDKERQLVVGRIVDIDDATINVLATVEDNEGNTCLLPLNDELVDEVDKASHRIVMTIPAGLLEL